MWYTGEDDSVVIWVLYFVIFPFMRRNILLTGGGTLGPVAPLIAVFEELEKRNPEKYEFHWIGTERGPENALVARKAIQFSSFPAAKFRRYFSPKTLYEPFVFLAALIGAVFYFLRWRPRVILSAGGFVSVPVVIVGKFLFKIPVLIHQQDIILSLSNKLMAPCADVVTITFPEQKKDFPKQTTVITGNPARVEVQQAVLGNKEHYATLFNLEKNIPTIFVFGGGTGAEQLNTLLGSSIEKLTTMCQVIHVTGRGKSGCVQEHAKNPRYHMYEFLSDPHRLAAAIAVADIVVTRAGMSSITELSTMGKASVVIPMPGTHQEANAKHLQKHDAGIYLAMPSKITEEHVTQFIATVSELIADEKKRKTLGTNMSAIMRHHAAERIADEVEKLV